MNIHEITRRRSLLFFGLVAAHLPLLVSYYRQLLRLEHYQFYPLALLCFGWLLYQRFPEHSWKWTRFSSICIALNLILLVPAFYLTSPWLGAVAGLFFGLAVCRALRNEESGDSLIYLTLLPLMTIRLPLGLDMEAIHWLQRLTTTMASNVLNFFELLHLREGNVLEFPGKKFLVEEACSGVQSLFTVFFIATLIICVSRRPWFRSLLILASAFCFAGVMNIVRICAISIGWQQYRLDLSTGWQHDAIGYATLALAATLVFSTDAFLGLMLSPIPDGLAVPNDSGVRNPLTALWNRVCGQRSRPDNSRRAPRLWDFFRPSIFFGWAWTFLQNWVSSRDWKLLPLAVVFVTAGSVSAGFWWLETIPQQDIVVALENAMLNAAKTENHEAKRIYLRALLSLRPQELSYRFQLASHFLETDQTDAAAQQISALTQPGANDYAPARVWLASQALSDKPIFPLTDDQIEGHLLMALNVRSEDPQIRMMLAEVYTRKEQLQAAESQLYSIVRKSPEVALSLARINKRLGRSDETIERHLSLAFDYFSESLAKNPTSVDHRIQFAEALVLGKRLSDAERVLKEGLARNSDAVQLRTALAEFYRGLAATRLRESLLNRDLCVAMLIEAIRLTPENRAILQQALTLSSLGAPFQLKDLKPAIDTIETSDESTIEERIMRIRALAAAQQIEQAIVELQPLCELSPELNIVMARLLKSAGRTGDSETLVGRLLIEMKVTAEGHSLKEILEYADVLNLASRFNDSLSLLNDAQKHREISDEERLQFNLLLGQTSIAYFDQKLAAGTFTSVEEALHLLQSAWKTQAVSLVVLRRLSELSCSEGAFSKAADDTLDSLLTETSASADVYNMVGTMALNKNQNSKARRYLERALRLDHSNPMVKNNLSLALVRDEDSDPDRALELVNQTLSILPENPDVLSTRAEVYIAQKRWEEARQDLEVSYRKRPKSPDCCRLLAQVCDAMGESSLAEKYRNNLAQIQSSER